MESDMKNTMIIVTAAALLSLSVSVQAEGMKRQPRTGNFTHEATHTLGNGKTLQRKTVQQVENGALNRTTTLTTGDGNTASRGVTRTLPSRDAVSGAL
jgi:hypothetical protein